MTRLSISLHSIPHMVAAVIITSLGIFTYLKNRNAPLNRWFALFCIAVSLWYGGLSIAMNVTGLSAHFFWEKAAHTGVIFGPPIYFGLTLRLLRLEKFRVVLFLYGVIAAIICELMWTTNLYFTGETYRYWWGIYPKASVLLTFNAILTILAVLSCFWLFPGACRHAKRQGQRDYYNQLKYMCVALAVVACTPLDYLPKFGIAIYPFGYVFGLIFALIMTYAIVRHHVMDINIVFRKGLAYSILVTGITLVYLVSVLLAEKLSRRIFGYQNLIATLISAVIIAVGFIPFKNAIEGFVNSLFYKGSQAKLTEENERLKQELVHSERLNAVSTLAAGMAHEIKNPLTALRTFGEYLPEKHNDVEFVQKFHEVLTKETRRIQEIVQDVLDFAKPRAPQVKPVEMGTLLYSTTNLLSSELLKHRIECKIDCRHDGAMLRADSDQLRQVLINLIQNAADAMPNGGTLSLTTRSVGGHLELTVSDTGHGIPKELLPKIFDPFVTTKSDGNGLGLAMVHSIIRAHGGSIHAASQPDHGTTFTVALPL